MRLLQTAAKLAALTFIAERVLAMTAPKTHDRLLRRKSPRIVSRAASYVAAHPQVLAQVATLVGGMALGRQTKARRGALASAR